MSEPGEPPARTSYRSLAGLVAFSGLAVVGLFILPVFQALGLAFRPAFWLVLAIEAIALAGVVASILTLHQERTLD